MTGHAVIHDTDMIKCRGFKTRGLVAVDAIAVGWYMIVVFARGGKAIVTGCTVTGNPLVIKVGACKGGGVMTH